MDGSFNCGNVEVSCEYGVRVQRIVTVDVDIGGFEASICRSCEEVECCFEGRTIAITSIRARPIDDERHLCRSCREVCEVASIGIVSRRWSRPSIIGVLWIAWDNYLASGRIGKLRQNRSEAAVLISLLKNGKYVPGPTKVVRQSSASMQVRTVSESYLHSCSIITRMCLNIRRGNHIRQRGWISPSCIPEANRLQIQPQFCLPLHDFLSNIGDLKTAEVNDTKNLKSQECRLTNMPA